MKPQNRARKYLITSLIGLAIGVGVFAARDGFNLREQTAILQAFCDAFFVPGILLVGYGALVFCADDGLFDMINYGVLKVIKLVQSEKRRSNFPKTFYEYRKMKSESRNSGFGYLLITGCAFIALAVVFLILSEM